MDPEILRAGPGDALADGHRSTAAHVGTDECRPSAARGVRQRLRSGGRDGYRRGHQGRDAGTQVPVGCAGQRRSSGGHEARLRPCSRSTTRRPRSTSSPICSAGIPTSVRCTAPVTPRPRCGNSTAATSTRSSSTSTCRDCPGIELAGVLANFSNRPAVVFVTAHDDKAVAAFDVGAIDYLLKPIREDRLDEAVRRVAAARSGQPEQTVTTTPTSSRPSSAASRTWCHGTASAGSRPRVTTRGCTPRRARTWFEFR